MSKKPKQQQIFPGPCPIDPNLGIPICPPPTEIDIIKVQKVFNECMHTQVEEVVFDIDKAICKLTTQTQEVQCLSAAADNINCEVLGEGIVRVSFELDVAIALPVDTCGVVTQLETFPVSKVFRVDRAGEPGLNVQCHVFPQCLFCFISRRDKCLCIFDNLVEEAFNNLPDNEIKASYVSLYNKYSPILAQVIRARPDLSKTAYKLFSKYAPVIQNTINENYGKDIQINPENITKIASFIEELKNEIINANLHNTPQGQDLIAAFNRFGDLGNFANQSLSNLLKGRINSYRNNRQENGNNSVICLKPIGVREVTCCVGVLILIKVDSEVQLLVPTYGYPAPPPDCGEFLGECPTDFTPEWPPYPPQTGFGGISNLKGCKGCK